MRWIFSGGVVIDKFITIDTKLNIVFTDYGILKLV